jgi:AAA domain-containing protein
MASRSSKKLDTRTACPTPEIAGTTELVIDDLESFPLTPTKWLWKDRIESGQVTILQGEKGSGKSTWLRRIAAYVCGVAALPSQPKLRKPLGSVLWYAAEEPVGSRVRPGLEAVGIPPGMVKAQDGIRCKPSERLQLPHDCDRLARLVDSRKAALVVIDPLFSFVAPGIDLVQLPQVARDYMFALAQVCAKTGTTIVLSRNLTKSRIGSAVDAGRGNAEIGNCARSVLHTSSMPASDNYALAIAHCNAGAKAPTITYTLSKKGQPGLIHVLGENDTTADDLVAGIEGDTDRYLRRQASDLIQSLVPKEGIESRVIRAKAEEAMISIRTLQMAARALGVICKRSGSRESTVSQWFPPEGGWRV